MRRGLAGLVLVLATIVAAACGQTTEVREPDLVISPAGATPERGEPEPEQDDGRPRIAVVTHGEAASEFWVRVRNGALAAERETDVIVNYNSPDEFSETTMRRLINDAVDSEPDGLVVSLPTDAVYAAVRRAVRKGVPVVSINSGSGDFRKLGVLAHVGQPEFPAGFGAGQRMAEAGVRNALCLNQEPRNVGLQLRCRGFARALRAAGGRAEVYRLEADAANADSRLRATIDERDIDGMLTLGTDGAAVAMRVGASRPSVKLASFDLSPEILDALEAKRMLFTIDQQPFLQGYLPVALLGQLAKFGLFPAQGKVIPTGPHFVTPETAGQAERLSRVQIR